MQKTPRSPPGCGRSQRRSLWRSKEEASARRLRNHRQKSYDGLYFLKPPAPLKNSQGTLLLLGEFLFGSIGPASLSIGAIRPMHSLTSLGTGISSDRRASGNQPIAGEKPTNQD